MRGLLFAILVAASALGFAAAPGPAAPAPSVYQVATAQRPVVAGAVANLEACVHHGTRWRVSCATTGQALEVRTLAAIRAISTASPGRPVACSLEFAGVQAAAWAAAGRAGANYRRPRLRDARLALYRDLNARALVVRARCFGPRR